MLADLVADTITSVDGGAVFRMTREDVAAQFEAYFGTVDIVRWESVEEPIVRLAPGGISATVIRRVRMERDVSRLGARTRDTVVLAWSSGYERIEGVWRMVSVATTALEMGPSPASVARAARRAIGWSDARRDSAWVLGATVEWAGPPYDVEVSSTRSGTARLHFVDGATMAIGETARWAELERGTPVVLSDTLETFLRGHDYFLNLIEPGTRFRSLSVAGDARFGGAEAVMVTGVDALGSVVKLYYAREDTLPLGYEIQDHLRGGPEVRTRIRDWAERDRARIPRLVRFTQGDDVFDYTVSNVTAYPPVSDSLFLYRSDLEPRPSG